MDDDAADDIDRDVSDERPAGCASNRVPVMGMSVEYEIDIVAVDDFCQFGVPEERILHSWFCPQRRQCRGNMCDDDGQIRVNTRQSEIEARRVATRTNGKRLDRSTGKCVRTLDRPEAPTGTLNTGKANPQTTVQNDGGTIQDRHPR